FTLVSMVAALAFLASAWWSGSAASGEKRPAEAARFVAQSISGLIGDVPSDDLDTVLRVMASGRLRFPTGEFPHNGPLSIDADLSETSYVAVLSPNGQL